MIIAILLSLVVGIAIGVKLPRKEAVAEVASSEIGVTAVPDLPPAPQGEIFIAHNEITHATDWDTLWSQYANEQAALFIALSERSLTSEELAKVNTEMNVLAGVPYFRCEKLAEMQAALIQQATIRGIQNFPSFVEPHWGNHNRCNNEAMVESQTKAMVRRLKESA